MAVRGPYRRSLPQAVQDREVVGDHLQEFPVLLQEPDALRVAALYGDVMTRLVEGTLPPRGSLITQALRDDEGKR